MFKLGRRSIIILLAMMCVAGITYAKESYWTDFNAHYGTSGGNNYQAVLGSCLTCHTSGSTRNAYGNAFRSANHDLAAIEGLDSDGDGVTNIEEINAGTFPGDAASHPAPPPTPADTEVPQVVISSPHSERELYGVYIEYQSWGGRVGQRWGDAGYLDQQRWR